MNILKINDIIERYIFSLYDCALVTFKLKAT